MRTIYLCYFGLREPLVQTQVLPYLRELAKAGIGVGILTFEPGWPQSWTAVEQESWKTQLAREGIEWRALRYHKRPSVPATLYDIFRGGVEAARWARASGASIFHGRAHMAMAMAMIAKSLAGGSTIFDLRGFVADEYVEAGIWKENGLVYRLLKKFESFAIRRADELIVLTRKVKDLLVQQGEANPNKIEIIPCCVDFARFDLSESRVGERAEKRNRFTLLYAGSVTGLYLLEDMGRFFLALRARRPNAFFRVLTASNPEGVERTLVGLGIERTDFEIRAALPSQMPKLLGEADVGISFIKASFSKIASSPTKIPEYLAAGLPVLSSTGMGDTDEILSSDNVGSLIQEYKPANFEQMLDELDDLLVDPALSERCKASAKARFDLKQVGGVRYRQVYDRIGSAGASRPLSDALIDREG